MDNLSITYQLPSGENHELELSQTEIIEALIEKGADGVLPMLVTNIELSSKSQCGKSVKTTILNHGEFAALVEIE